MENFEIICKLGSGGFSKVYKVKRKIDNKIYALKKVQMLNLSEKQKISSLNEVRVLASIKNKYVINYKEAFLDEKDCTLCLVMEYADRGDLENIIKEHKQKSEYFREEDIWKIFINIVKGLKSLHDKGIIHRDIKSSNIFLFNDGIAKLGDLNICKIISNENLGHTQAGTPAYAAPEVWMQKPYGKKSDIWSLGCVLYEMIALKCPFREDNMVKLYNKVLVGEYKKIPNNFSNDLNWIIEHMINSEIDKRFSCEELLNCDIIIKRMETKNQTIRKCYSEKKIKEYKIKNYKNETNNNKNNLNNILYKYNKEEENEENKFEDPLLKTIIMPINLLYLKDQLPKANYSQEIKSNNLYKNRESIQINSELSSSISLSKIDKDKSMPLLKIKRKSFETNLKIKELKNLLNKENIGQVKLKSINSTLISSEIINSNSLDNPENTILENRRNISKGKSQKNLNNKLKDYLNIYEKEKISNENIISQNFKKNNKIKDININNKLKLIFNSKIKSKSNGINKDFQFKLRTKNENRNISNNNRYNNDEDNHNNYEIYHEINNNKLSQDVFQKKCFNNIRNKSYINNDFNIFPNNVNNYRYNQNDTNNFIFSYRKKKSVNILPKIK